MYTLKCVSYSRRYLPLLIIDGSVCVVGGGGDSVT